MTAPEQVAEALRPFVDRLLAGDRGAVDSLAAAVLEAIAAATAKAAQETANYMPVTDILSRARAEHYGVSLSQSEFVRVLAQHGEKS